MTLKIIGAGFGRTGTMSLKVALEQLGFGPCYHMVEVFQTYAFAQWTKAVGGEPVDWDELFRGFASAVDFPACGFYRELAARYPQAKVILTEREANSWYDSAMATIFNPQTAARATAMPGAMEMLEALFTRFFGVPLEDRAAIIAAYRRHNEEVKRTVPRERLLVYDVANGWSPLGAFLGVAVPEAPFPKLNTREGFGHMAEELSAGRGRAGEERRQAER
jgi:Sulfotransferase domain